MGPVSLVSLMSVMTVRATVCFHDSIPELSPAAALISCPPALGSGFLKRAFGNHAPPARPRRAPLHVHVYNNY